MPGRDHGHDNHATESAPPVHRIGLPAATHEHPVHPGSASGRTAVPTRGTMELRRASFRSNLKGREQARQSGNYSCAQPQLKSIAPQGTIRTKRGTPNQPSAEPRATETTASSHRREPLPTDPTNALNVNAPKPRNQRTFARNRTHQDSI